MIENKDLAAMRALMKGAGGGGGGGASIDVTAQVGQTIVVKEVDANGKPTAWESADYQEKICGEGVGTLLETSFTLDTSNMTSITSQFVFDVGENYIIVWNGVEYQCEGTDFLGDGSLIGVGNGAAVGLTDTSEPFLIACSPTMVSVIVVMAIDGASNVTLSITGKVVNTIPKKYLPPEIRVESPAYYQMILDLGKWTKVKDTSTDIFSECEDWENTQLTKEHYDELVVIFKGTTPILNISTNSIGCAFFSDDALFVNFYKHNNAEIEHYLLEVRWSDDENCVQRYYRKIN